MTGNEYKEPLDCNGRLVQIEDEVRSTSLLREGAPLVGVVVDMGFIAHGVKAEIATNIITVQIPEGLHYSAAFLWEVVGRRQPS